MAEGASVTLQFSEPDAFFALKRIEETEITAQALLQKLQAQIAEIQLNKVRSPFSLSLQSFDIFGRDSHS